MGLRIPPEHWLYLVAAFVALFPIVVYSPLSFIVLFFLFVVCRLPIPVQTGAGYVPHPIYCHPLFMTSVLLGLTFGLVSLSYIVIRSLIKENPAAQESLSRDRRAPIGSIEGDA